MRVQHSVSEQVLKRVLEQVNSLLYDRTSIPVRNRFVHRVISQVSNRVRDQVRGPIRNQVEGLNI